MQGYIKYSDLIELYKIPIGTLKAGMDRNRKGLSNSWRSIKDINDRRRVLIELESIPVKTRQKYSLPKSSDTFSTVQTDIEYYYSRLQDAFLSKYFQYIKIYHPYFPNDSRKVKQYAQLHAAWGESFEFTGKEARAERNTLKPVYKAFNKLDTGKKYRYYKHFSDMNSKIRKMGVDDKSIAFCLLGNSFGVKRNYFTGDFHTALALYYLSRPNRYAYRVVADLVNAHAEDEDRKSISESWVKDLMQDNFYKTLVSMKRYGKKRFNDTVDSYLPRNASPFPGTLWMIDGTPVQFWCKDENGRTVRAYLFVVLDVCTRKIVGFDIGKSEDRYMVINSLKMAVSHTGHLPSEIVSDNFSANRTDELKIIQSEMTTIGCTWRHSKVGNAQDKSYVERWVRTFQSTVCTMYDDYIGEGITSKDINGRPDRNFLDRVIKLNGIPSYNEMRLRIAEMIGIYNDLELRGKTSPNVKYKSLPSPNARPLTEIDRALIFWNTKEITIKRSMVRMKVNKVQYHYTIHDLDLKLALNDVSVLVRYDEKDLSNIMLFDKHSNDFITEIKQTVEIEVAQIDQSEKDEVRVFAHSSRKKAFHNHIESTLQNEVAKGVQDIEDFVPKNPLEITKQNGLSQESRQLKEYYIMDSEINTNEVQETYKPIDQNEYEKQIDFIGKQLTRKKKTSPTYKVVGEVDQ